MTTRLPAQFDATRASPAPRILRCDTLRRLDEIPTDVAELFVQAEQADPQYGLGWFRNLTETVFAADAGVCLHVLRVNNHPVAALPLHVRATARGYEARALGNFYTCLYAPALHEDLAAHELAALMADVKRVHAPLASISLTPLDSKAPSSALMLQALRLARLHTYSHEAFGNWFLPVTGSCADYLADRPGELRNTLKRMGKKFAAAGGRFEIADQPDQVAAAMAAYSAVYSSSWKKPEPFERFMPGLAQLCAAKGWLRVGLAWLGDRPIAAQFWIVAGAKAHIYKLAYDAEFRQFSPGSLLTAQLMQRVIDGDGVHEVDYLKGDDAYKNQWMTHRRERLALLAFNPRTAGGLLGMARESTGRALMALKLRKRPDSVSASLAD